MSSKKKKRQCGIPELLSENDLFAIVAVNKLIEERMYYGLRKEKAEADSTVLAWSNAYKKWNISSGKIKKGENIELDANHVLAPFSPVRLEAVSCFLKELPLYKGSFEAKIRGEVTPQESLAEWIKGWTHLERLKKHPLYEELEEQYWDFLTEEKEENDNKGI